MSDLFFKIKFTNNFVGIRDRFILEIFYQTGIRVSELIDLEMQHLDKTNKTLIVFGKGRKERIIPLLNNLIKFYDKYILYRKEIKSNFLFVTEKSKKTYPKMIYRIVNKYLGMVSTLSKKSPHVLRHTFATHLYRLKPVEAVNFIDKAFRHSTLYKKRCEI